MKISQKTVATLLSLTMAGSLALPALAAPVDEGAEASTVAETTVETTTEVTKPTTMKTYQSIAQATEDEEEAAEDALPIKDVVTAYHNPNGRVMSVAYTGNSRSYPEDSLQSIKSAMNKNVDIVSVSVQKTADDQLVLMEDNSISRMLINRQTGETASGKVSDYTLQELQEGFYLRSGHGGENNAATKDLVATLEDAIELSSDNLMLYITNGWKYASEINALARELEATDTTIIGGATSADSITQFLSTQGTPVCHVAALYKDGSNEATPKEFAQNTVEAGADLVLFQTDNANSNIFKSSNFKKVKDSARFMISLTNTGVSGGYRDMIVDWEALINTGYSVLETDYPAELSNYIADVEDYRSDLTALISQGESLNALTLSKTSQKSLTKALEEATEITSTGATTLSLLDETRYNLQETIDALEAGEEVDTASTPTYLKIIIIVLAVLVGIGLIILILRFMNKRKKETNKKERDHFKNSFKHQSEKNLANAVKEEQHTVKPINANSTADNIVTTIKEDSNFQEIKKTSELEGFDLPEFDADRYEPQAPATPEPTQEPANEIDFSAYDEVLNEEPEVVEQLSFAAETYTSEDNLELFGTVEESEQSVINTTRKNKKSSAFLKKKK